jgi:hypothetical protein
MVREPAERGLDVLVGPRLEAITGSLCRRGELAVEVARNLFGEHGIGMIDGHNMRCAQDSEHQRAAVRVV